MSKRKRRSKGFLGKMNDKKIIDYTLNLHGKSITGGKLQKSDSNLYRELSQRRLISKLKINPNIKKNGFFTQMSDRKLTNYIKDKHKEKNIKLFHKDDASAYKHAKDRGLLDYLVDKKIIKRIQIGNNFFQNMNNKKFISYLVTNYSGWYITNLSKKDYGAYRNIKKRRLLEILVKKGIILRTRNPDGFHQSMSNENLKKYVAQKHKGKTITELSTSEKGAYRECCNRKILNSLVDAGTIIRKRQKYSKVPTNDLREYIINNHMGKSISEFMNDDRGAFNEAKKRGIIKKLLTKGILIKKRSDKFVNMIKEELKRFIKRNYKGNGIKEFAMDNGGAYSAAKKIGLIEELVKENILIRRNGQWQNENYLISEVNKSIRKHGYEIFSSKSKLKESGYGKLIGAIERWQGGIILFRERIGYNESKRTELAKELELILGEI